MIQSMTCIFFFPTSRGTYTQIDDTVHRFTYDIFFFLSSTVNSKKEKGSECVFHNISDMCVICLLRNGTRNRRKIKNPNR